jgi:adenosylhomocysteine nucleosidase
MILVFCAFGAEFESLRTLLTTKASLNDCGLRGFRGRIGDTPVALVKTGVGFRNARDATVRAVETLNDIQLVVMTGVAGALRDDLPIGRVVLADKLMTREDGSFRADRILEVPRNHFEIFTTALQAAKLQYAAGPMLTSRRAIITGADKRLAHKVSGAVSVDMESAVIAIEADARGLPFVCMRTILDTAGEDLPVANLIDENGHVRPFAAAKALVTHPGIMVAVARFARNLRFATRSLAVATDAVFPGADWSQCARLS